MKARAALLLFLPAALWGRGDTLSGPSRTTIQNLSWGTIYYEPQRLGACSLSPDLDGFKLTSEAGQVVIQGSEAGGFRLSCGRETLTLLPANGGGGIDIRSQGKVWTLRTVNGAVTLSGPAPLGTLVYQRDANTLSIEGPKGTVKVVSEGSDLRIQSPLGVTAITGQFGARTFSGPALDRIPYLGRGLFIPFHGAGLFVDITRAFPMPELAEWLDWKPLLQP